MKKRVFLVVLTIAVLFTFAGCKDKVDTTGDDTDTTTAATTVTTTAPEASTAPTTTTTAAEDEKGSYYFTCDELHFSLTMPASWEGAFAHRHDGNVVKFYELSNHLYEGNGHLFTVRFMPKEVDIVFPDYKLLGTYGDYNVIALFPTDVQFDYTDADRTANYQKMAEEVNGVIATFVYNGET